MLLKLLLFAFEFFIITRCSDQNFLSNSALIQYVTHIHFNLLFFILTFDMLVAVRTLSLSQEEFLWAKEALFCARDFILSLNEYQALLSAFEGLNKVVLVLLSWLECTSALSALNFEQFGLVLRMLLAYMLVLTIDT